MNQRPVGGAERTSHWNAAYQSKGASGVSWHQAEPEFSLRCIDALGITANASLIDVGGGASVLVDRLIARGWSDLSVLDVSDTAMAEASERLGAEAPVHWLHEDILVWQPARRYDVWHDRAVFHFLVTEAEQRAYLQVLSRAIAPGGAVILGTFGPDGPEVCSGLPVRRWSAEDLIELLGGVGFSPVETLVEDHRTPWDAHQQFVWVAARSEATAG